MVETGCGVERVARGRGIPTPRRRRLSRWSALGAEHAGAPDARTVRVGVAVVWGDPRDRTREGCHAMRRALRRRSPLPRRADGGTREGCRDEARASWSKPIAASSSERTREGCRARRHASRGRNRLQRRAGGAWEGHPHAAPQAPLPLECSWRRARRGPRRADCARWGGRGVGRPTRQDPRGLPRDEARASSSKPVAASSGWRGRDIPTPRRRRLSRWSALGAEHGLGRPTRQDPRGLPLNDARASWSTLVAASSGWRVGGASPRRAAGASPVGVLLAPSTAWGDPRDRTREGCRGMTHAPRGRPPLPRRAGGGTREGCRDEGTRQVVETGCSVERVARGRGIPMPRRRRLSRWSALGAEHGLGRPTRQDPRGLPRDDARASWSTPVAASSGWRVGGIRAPRRRRTRCGNLVAAPSGWRDPRRLPR